MVSTIRQFVPFIVLVFAGAVAAAAEERRIVVDFERTSGPFPGTLLTSVGAGRANEGLRADWQAQLAELRQEIDFRYIRMHGLLSDDMGVFKIGREGEVHYNWQYIDVLYDFILDIGMKPFVELGFMPSGLASGDQTIFWWRGNVTPPHDYDRWEDLVYALVRHLTDRYGEDEVSTWYFEVWNEPNLDGFWTGTQDDYFRLYRHSANAIKRVSPRYRVGGPATAGAAWTGEMIRFCVDNDVPIDFISTHDYGVQQGFLDEFGQTGTVLNADPRSVVGEVMKVRAIIEQSPLPDLELHFTEWSSSYTPADPFHDSYQQAPWVLQRLKQIGTAADSMSFWVFTDIFEEAGPRFTPFHGGFGLVNLQGIRKPTYYAYAFVSRLSSIELVNRDASSWVTRNEQGDVQILFWDSTYTLPEETNNQAWYVKDLPARGKGNVRIRVDNMPPGVYTVTTYQTGYRVNDPYTQYLDMGAPRQLDRRQVTTLKNDNDGAARAVETVEVGGGGAFEISVPLRENDVFLITLERR